VRQLTLAAKIMGSMKALVAIGPLSPPACSTIYPQLMKDDAHVSVDDIERVIYSATTMLPASLSYPDRRGAGRSVTEGDDRVCM
jgi:hypothetical protein